MSTQHKSLHPLPDSHNKTPVGPQSLADVRLRKHAEFQRAYAAARKRQSQSMSWFLAPREMEPRAMEPKAIEPRAAKRGPAPMPMQTARVGLTVGKVLGKAHDRNRIKRRMREALRRHVELLPPGCDLIFHPRRAVLTLEFAKLEAEVVRILVQAGTEAARSHSIPAARPSSAAVS
jgi:ribonuclease P protein component